MKFYYAIDKRKFDKAWAKLAKTYEEAGMEPEAIQAMYEFDWGVFKAARVEALHTQEFTIPESTDDDLSECESPLFEKFQDRLSSEYDTLGGHSRYWWIDELTSPCLTFGAAALSEKDKELLTLYIIEELTVREIAKRLGESKSAVDRGLKRIFALFPIEA